MILSAIWVTANAVSFWLVDGREVANSVTYGSSLSTSYPITIYGPWLRRVMCYAVPAAFVAYFPRSRCWAGPTRSGSRRSCNGASPLVAAAAVAVAGLVWRTGVRHYQGTGS